MVHARVCLDSTGRSVGRSAGQPAAHFSKYRKVMKYRERQAKLLMRRGPL